MTSRSPISVDLMGIHVLLHCKRIPLDVGLLAQVLITF